MEDAPNLYLLRKLAWKGSQVIIPNPDPEAKDSWALVTIDNAGKGTDPDGKRGAALAFERGAGMKLQDVADVLAVREV